MARRRASTAATGGKGYTFADKVAARFLAQMLKRAFPFEYTLGSISQIHFETGESGHIFDDFRLELRQETTSVRVLITAKSNRQLTENGFRREFVLDAWEQWNSGETTFSRDIDLLGLVVGLVGDGALAEWKSLQDQASATTPDRMASRVAQPRQLSKHHRAIFNSFNASSSGAVPSPSDIAQIISRIRVLHFSEMIEGESVSLCAELTAEGTVEAGKNLWSRLLQLTSEARATGGWFDVPKLIDLLRPTFELKDYPDFSTDWKRLAELSAENVRNVRDVIGDGIRLSRESERDRVKTDIDEHKVVALVGESGSGKSASLAQVASAGSDAFKRTIWIKPEQLSHPSHVEVTQALGLRHAIPDLIEVSASSGSVLVLDGLEKFEGAAKRRAIELIAALKKVGFAGWKLIVSCESHRWPVAQDALIEAGITDAHRTDFEKPTVSELREALREIPEIRILFQRTELQPILRNLVVLDWVLRAKVANRLSDASRVYIGETELIDCVWEHWVGDRDSRFARDLLLRTLGEDEGEKLSGAVHRDSLTSDQLTLLGVLERDRLVRVSGPSIWFVQDLMGDWARYRALKMSSDAAQKIKDVAQIPRWGQGIRLFAQSLAEHGEGLAKWKSLSSQLGTTDATGKLANDLFLDGIIFAANSELLMEQVWPDLIADKGAILRRLIRRLQQVATFPDFRLQGLVTHVRQEDLEAWFRIPNPLYWLPAFRVFARHSPDLCKYALIPTAEMCALWLRVIPREMFLSEEAGRLAIDLAKEIQGQIAEDIHFGDKDQVIYEALMWAANEFPDEVANVALELCGRREVPKHAILRAVEAQEREAKSREEWRKTHPEENNAKRRIPPVDISSLYEVMRGPHSDGPQREVPDGFRLAVWETHALSAIVRTRPDVAREILLAICIDEPRRVRGGGPFDDMGLSNWNRGYPSGYWKGPFLSFLQEAPGAGLDAIVRLVNYATNRWLERAGPDLSDDHRREYGLEFQFGDRKTLWIGNGHVYGWHRSSSLDAATLECALMALEKWLFDEVENGKSIAPWIEYISARGNSLAFAGVLISVGLKSPALFAKELQPLLGNPHIYDCQLGWALSEGYGSWGIAWAGKDDLSAKLAAEWHQMPHRRIPLQDVAQRLMFHDRARDYLVARAAEWKKQFAAWGRDDLKSKLFLAIFDPANYSETQQGDGPKLIEMRLPTALEENTRQAREEGQIKMLAVALASRARAYLSDEGSLSQEQLPEFLFQLKQLSNWHPADDTRLEKYRLNSLAGGLAVLFVKHRGWLSLSPENENWCIEALRSIKLQDDPDRDSPHSIISTAAESFLGEAGVALLVESDDEWVLRLVFDGVTGYFHSSTLYTVLAAYFRREQLGERFGELLNIVIFWSALRRAADRESMYQADRPLLAKYKRVLFQRYVRGRLRGQIVPLRKIEKLGSRLVERITQGTESTRIRRARRKTDPFAETGRRRLDRDLPDIDLTVLQNGFGFLWAMVRDRDLCEEQQLHRYVRELFDAEMRTLPHSEASDNRSEIEGTPYEFDRWVLQRIAELLSTETNLEVARAFYRPIVDLGPAARYWIEDFLKVFLSSGLGTSKDLESFAKLWSDIANYAMSLPGWQPTKPGYWCPAETIAADLMGLREPARTVLGKATHAELVRSMLPVYEKWASAWLRFGSATAWFAYFLITESGQSLLPMGIKELAKVVDSVDDRDWYHHDLGGLLAEVLSICWKTLQAQVEAQNELRDAFLHLLTVLCARQIPEAVHLRLKVAAVLS